MSALDDVRRALTEAYGTEVIFDGLTVEDLLKAVTVDGQLDIGAELRAAAADIGDRVRAGGPRARGLAFARTVLIARANGKQPPGRRIHADHGAVAQTLRDNPQAWLPVSDYPTKDSAASISWGIRRARYSAYEPDSAFEARIEPTLDGYRVFARYVGTDRKDSSL